ncbi:hypothetical protein [Legionella sp. CNM-4043-24]|uniref:hypothetical protein n=1 Tax=Legionella sp. CNM-4043-24 TaxID=3421646 RepID=UPI00403AFCD5
MAEIVPPSLTPEAGAAPTAPKPLPGVDDTPSPSPVADNSEKSAAPDTKAKKQPQEPAPSDNANKKEAETGDPWLDMWTDLQNRLNEKSSDSKVSGPPQINSPQKEPQADKPAADNSRSNDASVKAPEPMMSTPSDSQTDPSPEADELAAFDRMDASSKTGSMPGRTPDLDAEAALGQAGPALGA